MRFARMMCRLAVGGVFAGAAGATAQIAVHPMDSLGGVEPKIPMGPLSPTPQARPPTIQYPSITLPGLEGAPPAPAGARSGGWDLRFAPRYDPRYDGRRFGGHPYTRYPWPFDTRRGYDEDRCVVLTPGAGLAVRGHYEGDKLSLDVHLGSGATRCYYPSTYGYRYYYPWSWGYSGYRVYDGRAMYPIYGHIATMDSALYQQPAAPPEPEPEPDLSAMTPKERAEHMFGIGDIQGVIENYHDHLRQNPDDAGAMRMLGLAYLLDGDPVKAGALLYQAYSAEPGLAERPIDAGVLPGGVTDLREPLKQAVRHANDSKTGVSWLTVAVVMQAEGRDAQALKMVDRAERAGLDAGVVRALRQGLRWR